MARRGSADRLMWMCGIIMTFGCSRSDEAPKAAGSGGQTVAAAASDVKTDNACRLLTKEEAAAVLSSAIDKVGDEGQPSPIGTMLRSSCFYRGDGGSVQITVNTYENAQDANEKFDRLKGLYSGARTVSGLGDAAFAEREALVVKQGNRHLNIDLKPEGAGKITDYSDTKQMDALLARERQIAMQALGRLPASSAATVEDATTSATSGKSVCSMVTKDEMEGFLGGRLSHAVPTDSPAKTVCTYAGPDSRYAQVSIEWQGGESGIAGTRLAGKLMGGAAGNMKVTTPVEGVGDEAVMLIGGVLNVRKGSALITVDLRMQENSEAKAKAIAQKVIAKL